MQNRILQPIRQRRARRAISDRPIPEELFETLLEAAHLAPSCANNQPWRMIVAQEPDVLDAVKAQLSGGNYWAQPSPAIIAVTSQVTLDCRIPDGREYFLLGCGMAAMNLMLQATEMGLIAHPIAGFKQAPIKAILRIPENHTLIVLIVLGYPSSDHAGLSEKHQAEEIGPRVRRPKMEVASWNAFPRSSED